MPTARSSLWAICFAVRPWAVRRRHLDLARGQPDVLTGSCLRIEVGRDGAVEDTCAIRPMAARCATKPGAEIALGVDADAGEGREIAAGEMDRHRHAARHPRVLEIGDDRRVFRGHHPGRAGEPSGCGVRPDEGRGALGGDQLHGIELVIAAAATRDRPYWPRYSAV